MTIDILGLGESIELFKPSDNITFGVNDIFRIHPVDYLVVVDSPSRFSFERLSIIKNSTPIKFLSNRKEYAYRPDYSHIELAFLPEPLDLDNKINVSLFSPYIATILAYKMFKPDRVNLYGVDMDNHPTLSNPRRTQRIKKDWNELYTELSNRNVKVTIHGNGILCQEKNF